MKLNEVKFIKEQLIAAVSIIGNYLDENVEVAKEEPEFKVGDVVWYAGFLARIEAIHATGKLEVRRKDNLPLMWNKYEVRHATEAETDDWYRRNIGHGVTVWAKDEGGTDYPISLFVQGDGDYSWRNYPRKEGLALCDALHVPVRVIKKEGE